MSPQAARLPFVARDPALGSAGLTPMMPITLAGTQPLAASALLDTGAALNVLPYDVGAQIGFTWERQTTSVRLPSDLASIEARVVLVQATVAAFPPVRLAFAWARQNGLPVLLGQVNFFIEFDVCFYRARSVFEVQPAR